VIEATDCSRPDRTGRSFWYSALGNRTRSFTGSSRSTSPGGSSRHAGRWLSVCCTANYCTVRGRQRWTARRRYDDDGCVRINYPIGAVAVGLFPVGAGVYIRRADRPAGQQLNAVTRRSANVRRLIVMEIIRTDRRRLWSGPTSETSPDNLQRTANPSNY